jgi:hypothetical protein
VVGFLRENLENTVQVLSPNCRLSEHHGNWEEFETEELEGEHERHRQGPSVAGSLIFVFLRNGNRAKDRATIGCIPAVSRGFLIKKFHLIPLKDEVLS